MTPERRVQVLERTLKRREKFWLRAARKALAGDLSELRNRVEMIDAGPLEIALSTEQAAHTKERQ